MNKKRNILQQRLNAIDDMDFDELKQKFFELYGFQCGNTTSVSIRKRIAYRLQEIALGEISSADMAFLEKVADRDPLSNIMRTNNEQPIINGMRLRREWKGVKHEVVSNGDGSFKYNGKIYQSLSAIAREITGTRWNGKVFFGVKK